MRCPLQQQQQQKQKQQYQRQPEAQQRLMQRSRSKSGAAGVWSTAGAGMTRSCGSGSSKRLFPHSPESAFLELCKRLLTVRVLVYAQPCQWPELHSSGTCTRLLHGRASNMLSTLCQYEAPKYASFVTQKPARLSQWYCEALYLATAATKQTLHTCGDTHSWLLHLCARRNITSAAAAAAAHRSAGSWLTYDVGMVLPLVYLAGSG
jgi:hypothetical protein